MKIVTHLDIPYDVYRFYLKVAEHTEQHTAEEWGHILADVADLMDHKSRIMQIEKWLAVRVQVKKK